MSIPQRQLLLLFTLASVAGVVALATRGLIVLEQGRSVAHAVADAVAHGLGGPEASPTNIVETISVSLFFGLIPVGPVDHPYLVVGIGDFVLGTLATGFAILLIYTLVMALRRKPSLSGEPDEKSRNA